jgi:hypothetical protein
MMTSVMTGTNENKTPGMLLIENQITVLGTHI